MSLVLAGKESMDMIFLTSSMGVFPLISHDPSSLSTTAVSTGFPTDIAYDRFKDVMQGNDTLNASVFISDQVQYAHRLP